MKSMYQFCLTLIIFISISPITNALTTRTIGASGAQYYAIKEAINGINNGFEPYSTLYVNCNATGRNDGTSWTNAFTSLQDAIDQAEAGDHIWVAQGVYDAKSFIHAQNSTSEDNVILLKKGIVILGGFSGTEEAGKFEASLRNPKSNIARINCEIKLIDDTLKSHRLLPTCIDGFFITPPRDLSENINPEQYFQPIIVKNCIFDVNSTKTDISTSNKKIEYATDRLLIKYKESSTVLKRNNENIDSIKVDDLTSSDRLCQKFHFKTHIRAYNDLKNKNLEDQIGANRWYMVTFPEGYDLEKIADGYRADENIDEVTFDFTVEIHLQPNDTYYYSQWGHKNTSQMPAYNSASGQHTGTSVGTVGFDSHLEAAYDSLGNWGNSEIIIGIIDTGVDFDHPDLADNIVTGYDFGSNDSDPDDITGHGTLCAGIAAAKANNGIGITGVAGNCKIMPLKVANQEGTMYFSAIQNALYYAADNGADIVSMSLGNSSISSDPATDIALQYAYNAGVLLIASAGNGNASAIEYPASNQYVIAAGAASPCGERKSPATCDGESWWGSSYGSDVQDGAAAVDIIAPSIIPATDIVGPGGYSSGDYFLYANGTSASSPFVAGVCALIKSAHPDWTPAQIKQQLIISTDDIAGGEASVGWDKYTGYGMVNAQKAFQVSPPVNYPPVFTATGPFSIPASSAEGVTVGDINAHNGNGGGNDGDITYSIIQNINSDADANDAFVINSSSGVITVNDAGDLDYAVNPAINIIVRADDGFSYTNANVTIYLTPLTANIIYVAADASGLNNGTNWLNAYSSLQTALLAAVSGDSIFVKYGTFKPTVADGDRNISFNIPSGVAVIGHFAGTESASWQRVLTNDTYETILSGDLNGNDVEFTNNGENSYHVVKFYRVSSLTILDGFTIKNGNSNYLGGGIWNDGSGGSNTSSPTIRHCKITYNQADSYGGGIFNDSYGSNVTSNPVIDNCKFIRNKTNGSGLGGAVYNSECSPVISNCYFERNFAIQGSAMLNSGWCFGAGGAEVTNCIFYDHDSWGGYDTQIMEGTVATLRGTASFANCTFDDNFNQCKGALYNYGSTVTATDCEFINNFVRLVGTGPDLGGAAINTEGGTTTVNNSVFNNNSVGDYYGISWPGGAIYTKGTNLNINNSIFRGNHSKTIGGAIFSSGGNIVFNNLVFSGNKSWNAGGAVCFVSNTSATITNCTFSGNQATGYGGGIYSNNTNTVIRNSIIWGNDADNMYDQIYNVSSTPVISYSDIQGCGGSGAPWDTYLGTDGGNNIDQNPIFLNSVSYTNAPTISGDYRVYSNSPVINVGNNDFVTTAQDLAGNDRIESFIVDLGAYETETCMNPTDGNTISGIQTTCYNVIPNTIINSQLPTGQNGILEFKWQSSTTSSGEGFSDISNTNTINYSPAALTQTTWFKRLARSTCKGSWIGASESNVIQITVLSDFSAGEIYSPGETICYNGDPGEIGSTAAAGGGDGTIIYKWQKSTTGDLEGFEDIASTNTAVYNPPAGLTESTWYIRFAKDGTCNTTFTQSSGVWEVSVRANFSAGEISTTGETICYNGDPEEIGNYISASGGDGSFEYQWQSSANGTFSDAVDIGSSTGTTYDPPSGLTATTTYRRLANDGTCNTTPTASSGTWTVTVLPQLMTGEIAITGETICYNDNPAVIGSVTDASGGDGAIEYQWQYSVNGTFNDATDISGATGNEYDPVAMTATAWFRRMAKDGTCDAFTTGAGTWKVTVDPPTEAGSVTGGTSVCYGVNSTVLTLTGYTGTIQIWQYSTDVTPWTDIPGTTSTTYTATNLNVNTQFRAGVKSGECVAEYSVPAEITMLTDYSIRGYAKYNNNPKTPLNGLKITLKQGVNTIGTPVVTGTSGFYEFTGLINGTYDLEIAPAHESGLWQTWGGVNNTDYLLVARHAAGVSYLALNPPVVRVAGDVKSPSTPPVITTADATAVKYAAKYGWGSPVPYFDIQKWVFSGLNESTALTGIVLSCADEVRDIRGLCAGDVNGSLVPPYGIKHVTPGIELVNRGMLDLTREITFPVRAESDLEIGAITLMLDFDVSMLEITGVEMPNQGDAAPYFFVTRDTSRVTEGVLNIGWMSLNPLHVAAGETMLLIHTRISNIEQRISNIERQIRFTLNDNPVSELADADGNVIDGAKLVIADAGHASPVTRHENLLSVYPNPVSESLTIEYLMETEGVFSAELMNPQGVVVVRTGNVNSRSGMNKTTLNLRELPNGAYLLKAVCGENQKTVKLIVNR